MGDLGSSPGLGRSPGEGNGIKTLKKKTIKREKRNNEHMEQRKTKHNQKSKEQESNFLPIHININVNGLNTPIKGSNCEIRLKCKTIIYCLQEIHFKYNDTNSLKSKRLGKGTTLILIGIKLMWLY